MLTTLSRRALNRAALERQFLLRPAGLGVAEAIGRLAGLQAQASDPPYLSLWSRIAGFQHEALTAALYDRSVVRAALLRGTQHMVTAADYRWLRPLLSPVLARGRSAAFGRVTSGIDLDELARAGRELLAGRTVSRPRLGRLLAERWPDRDPEALSRSVQALVPVVHVPPNGTWRKGGVTPFTLAEEWLEGPLCEAPAPATLILRYLAAFGPASVKDMQAWSGLTGLREIADALRGELRAFRGEDGQELFDLPEAPAPDPGMPVPPVLLPEFDNLITGHADRRRLMSDGDRKRVCVGSAVAATVLVDGMVAGRWRIRRGGRHAELGIQLFRPVLAAEEDALTRRAAELLAFAAPAGVAQEVRIAVAV